MPCPRQKDGGNFLLVAIMSGPSLVSGFGNPLDNKGVHVFFFKGGCSKRAK